MLAGVIAAILSAVQVEAQSSGAVVLYAQTSGPVTVPAGTTLDDIDPVSGVIPADANPTLTNVYRAVVYATAGSTATTLRVGLAGPNGLSVYNATSVNIPANSTVPILLETTQLVSAGTNLSGALILRAGAGGSLTIQPGTSITMEAIPTNTASVSSNYISR
jgi:hypothetical protein